MAALAVNAVPTVLIAGGATLLLGDYLDRYYLITRDFVKWQRHLRARRIVERLVANGATYADFWEQSVAAYASRVALAYEGISMTYLNVDHAANRVAHALAGLGVTAGDKVGLFLPNCPHYVFTLLALAKLGAVAVLISRDAVAVNVLELVRQESVRALVYGTELEGVVASVASELRDLKVRLLRCSLSLQFPPAAPAVQSTAGSAAAAAGAGPLGSVDLLPLATCVDPVDRARRAAVRPLDTWGCIYTTGASGRPKMFRVSHAQLFMISVMLPIHFRFRDTDIIYSPMRISTFFGVLGVCAAAYAGATLVIPPRFSAHRFWDDVIQSRATIIHHMGELCRYLLRLPHSPRDTQHNVRLAFGIGLRPDVVETFQQRFAIPEICEYYAHTETNAFVTHTVSLYQPDGRGAVGHVGPFTRRLGTAVLVQYDPATQSLVRDKRGRCVPCKPGQLGEILGVLDNQTWSKAAAAAAPGGAASDAAAAVARREDSTLVLARDVFRPGDVYIRTGDLMRMDDRGFYYYVDRIGNSIQWKGEVISSTVVAEALLRCPGVLEATAYSVRIAGHEEQPCMGAVVLAPGTNVEDAAFVHHLQTSLMPYAIPVFIRVLPALLLTDETFRHRRLELATQGADPTAVRDPLYLYDRTAERYRPLTAAMYQRLVGGRARL